VFILFNSPKNKA